jgi:Flp pilus assembly protein TadG
MHARSLRNRSRSGAAVVEAAVVLSVFLLILFGIIEYCRFLFIEQVVTNAAREGARYAVVNTSDATLVADTQAVVMQRMAGQDAKLTNFTVQLYQADANGVNDGLASDAQFGQYVVVQIDGDYHPMLPSFLFMNKTIHLQTKSLMCSEAN